MKLSKQLPIGLMIVGLFMMSATYLMLSKSDGLLKQYTSNGLEREAKFLTYLIEQNLMERYHDASVFPLVLGELESEAELKYDVTDPEFLASLNHLIKNYSVYRRIGIMDLNGEMIAENSRNHLGKTIFSNNISKSEVVASDWFTTISSTEHSVGDVFFFGPTKRIIDTNEQQFDLLIGSKIYDTQGVLVGYWLNILDFAIVEQRFEKAYQLLAQKGLPYAELTLLDELGNVIVDYDPFVQQTTTYERDFSVLGQINLVNEGVEGAKRAVAGFTGTIVSTHARKGIEQFSVFAHFSTETELPIPGWSTLIRVDKNIAYHEYAELMKLSKWIFFVALILIISLWYLSSRIFTRPLQKVTQAILEIANGNLEPEIEKRQGQDEVSSINNALLELKDKLYERDGLLSEVNEKQQLVELQRTAMNSMASGIMIVDVRQASMPIIFVNQAIEFLTGYRAEELIDQHYQVLWGAETERSSKQRVMEAIEHSKSCTCVMINYRKNLTTFINNLSVDPVFDDEGKVSHFILVHNDITEIKKGDEIARLELERRIEDSTRESREAAKRLRTVFDTAIDGSIVMNDKGIIIDVNHSLELMFGRKQHEMIGQPIAVLLPQTALKDDEAHQCYFNQEIRQFIGQLRTVKAQHKSGAIIIEISVGEARLENESLFVAAIRDITEQQAIKDEQLSLQKQLKERETIYRTAFDQAAVGIARVALDGKMLEVNQRICANLGYSEQELLELNMVDITAHEDLSLSKDYLKDLLKGNSDFHTLDKRYTRKDRSVFWANLNISLVRDDKGQPKYYISIIEDITERKIFEQELRDARDQREELIRGINIASEAGGICNWSYNIETDELRWDPSTYALYSVEEGLPLTYVDWRDRVLKEDIDAIEKEIKDAMQFDLAIESEFRFRRKGQRDVRWAKVAAAIVYDGDNKPVKMFGINIDITEQKRILTELEKETIAAQRANEAKSAFLATMSHEIRTPMNGVIGMIELLRQTPLNVDQKRMATTVRDSSFALLDIINDILDFSKIESGQIEIEWTPSSLLEIMEKTAANLWVNASNKNVDLVLEPDLSIPQSIAIDPLRIRQIILNLTGNAIKFSHYEGKRGLVKLVSRFDHAQSLLHIEVSDNGIGISETQLQSLFTPFQQADTSTTRKYGGTGLGLSITKSFVDLMGGEVAVRSKVGVGSTFSLTIPIPEVIDRTPEFSNVMLANQPIVIGLSKASFQEGCEHSLTQLGATDITVLSSLEMWQPVTRREGDKKPILICDPLFDAQIDSDGALRLMIEEDPIKPKNYVNPYLFVIAGHPLKPSELIHGIGVLCGMVSPDFQWSKESLENASTSMLTHLVTEGVRVLVAEDNKTNQMVIGRQLDNLGIVHDIANDGVEGLEMWGRCGYDLILTDCHMPNMDGYELTAQIRQREAALSQAPIPIIAITANALVGEAETCLKTGMSDYIAKPVEIGLLKSKLAHWLEQISVAQASGPNMQEEEREEGIKKGLRLETLVEVIGTDDKAIISEILTMYWESTQTEVADLESAISALNYNKIKSLAHAAKGASASSGAAYVSELFKQIEQNNQDIELASRNIEQIKTELTQIEQQLNTLGILI